MLLKVTFNVVKRMLIVCWFGWGWGCEIFEEDCQQSLMPSSTWVVCVLVVCFLFWKGDVGELARVVDSRKLSSKGLFLWNL